MKNIVLTLILVAFSTILYSQYPETTIDLGHDHDDLYYSSSLGPISYGPSSSVIRYTNYGVDAKKVNTFEMECGCAISIAANKDDGFVIVRDYYSYNPMHYSNDKGETWDTLFMQKPIRIKSGWIKDEYYYVYDHSNKYGIYFSNTKNDSIYQTNPDFFITALGSHVLIAPTNISGQLYTLKNDSTTNYQYFLMYSTDYGASFTEKPIPFEIAGGEVHHDWYDTVEMLFAGPTPGEVYIVVVNHGFYPSRFKLYRSTDYGDNWNFQSERYQDHSLEYGYIAGRDSCLVYSAFTLLKPNFVLMDLAYMPDLYKSTDCGCTFELVNDGSFVSDDKTYIDDEIGISIYPNPANSEINIKLNNPDNNSLFNVKIMDLTGKCLINEKLQQPVDNVININVSNLPNGVYAVQTFNDKKQFYSKFIINR
ncbi:MAG: T9SS type A sorting domain-containing protein [Bacteroidales bacterium]|jgi:hypothetical protein